MAIKRSKPLPSSSKSKSPSPQRPTSSSSGRTLHSSVSPSSSSAKPRAIQQPQTASFNNAQTDAMASRMNLLQSNWQRVAGTVALASLVNAIENVTVRIDDVGRNLATIRSRGYRYGRDWETQLETLRQRWPQQRSQAQQLLDRERRVLESSARDVDMLLQQATRNTGLVSNAESRVQDLERNVRTAESRVQQTFDGVANQANALNREIDQAVFVLNALDAACFELLPDEHVIAACQAIWTSDQQDPEGFLFLTSARVIFEQRQEVAKKKVLFITTEKELIQEKLWEAPIGAIEELEAEDEKAFLSRKEILTLRFHERTRELPSDVTLQLKGTDNDTWRALLRKAKSGEIEKDRFGAPAPEVALEKEIEAETAEPEKELPTVCPNCNAPLPQIFRGMKQVRCDYCDAVINL